MNCCARRWRSGQARKTCCQCKLERGDKNSKRKAGRHYEHTGDTSDEEIPEEEEETTTETPEVRMLRSIFGVGSSSR